MIKILEREFKEDNYFKREFNFYFFNYLIKSLRKQKINWFFNKFILKIINEKFLSI